MNRTKIFSGIYLGAVLLMSACQSAEEMLLEMDESMLVEEVELVPKAEIDRLIIDAVQRGEEFNWADASHQVLWSAVIYGDSIVSIGYAPENMDNVNARLGVENLRSDEWTKTKESLSGDLLNLLHSSGQTSLSEKDLVLHESAHLPYIDYKLYDYASIVKMRQDKRVRYLEPTAFQIDLGNFTDERYMSSSGCSNEPNYNIPQTDYSTVSPNAKASWHYDLHGVRNAWSQARGEGITVGLIDTGLSPQQAKLNGQFASGESGSRSVEKYGFHQSGSWWWKAYDGPDDGCGHGTAMAGVIAAPKSSGGSAVGVAYKANLISTRGTQDVIINSGSEKDGVSEALIFLANRNDVKVISMSIGDVFSSGKVADAIRYAYNRGKLIFAAAGTSTSFTNWYGVIFPANMNETVAVTGIKEGVYYQRCNTCHSGSKVDFTIVMERAYTDNHALTTAMSGDVPATVGGSSVATATAAGIAALVWSKYPNWSRQQVLDRLTQTADLYPNRSSSYGWGNLDAAAAVSDVVARN